METTTDMHAVFATTPNHATFRVSDPLGWGAAQNEWDRLDTLRREGRLPHVKFFEVRSVTLGPDRPIVGPRITSHGRYNGALLMLAYTVPVVAGSRGFAKVEDAARAAWKAAFPSFRSWHDRRTGSREETGVQGSGGWFYYSNGQTAAQGLNSLAKVCQRRGMIVQGGDGRWYVTAPTMPTENLERPDAVAV